MARAVRRTAPSKASVKATMAERFRSYIKLKKSGEALLKEADPMKKEFMSFLEQQGEADNDGNLWFTFEEPVEGYAAIQRQRRASTSVDQDAINRVLRKHDLWYECHRMVPVVDEDAIFTALAKGVLTDDEVAEMFPPKIIWAFVPSKDAP